MPQQTKLTLEQLEDIEKRGFSVLGDAFKGTLAYFHIQRQKESIASDIKRINPSEESIRGETE